MTAANLWVDVSSNNPYPDIAAYASAGYTHICRKVSEGTGYHWAEGDTLTDQAHARGLTVGHYHWLRPDQDPTAQADYFHALIVGRTRPGDVLMTDFEATSDAPDPSDAARAGQLRAFNQRVRARMPLLPLHVYTGNWYLAGKPACQAEVRRSPVVISFYDPGDPPNPYGLDYVAVQYTDRATVPGITAPVDCNRWVAGRGTASNNTHLLTPPTARPTEDDDMYTLFQIPTGHPNAGRQFAVRPGSVPIWLSPSDKAALTRFGWLKNPAKAAVILQSDIDKLTVAVKKGAL